MLIEAARRAEAAATEVLSLVNDGSASCAELREMLAVSKAAVAIMAAAQTSAAATIAGRERHGDGGAQVLADTAGMHRGDAHSRVKTARVIEAAPAVRDAVESGRVSQANAKRLADAISKTGADAVEADLDLLAKAQSMRPEQFTREARRWTADRQGAAANRSGAQCRAAPSPNPNGNCSSPNGAAASTAAPTPPYAKATTSNPPQQEGPPNSTTWSRRVGAATTASTTTAGGSARAPMATTPFTHPTESTTGPHTPPNSRTCCSGPISTARPSKESPTCADGEA